MFYPEKPAVFKITSLFIALVLALSIQPQTLFAQGEQLRPESSPESSMSQASPDEIEAALILFRDKFYMSEDMKFKHDVYEYRDFILQETSSEKCLRLNRKR